MIATIAPLSFAGLHWEETTAECVAPVGVDTVQVAFNFSNPETYPVNIVAVQPSCGCTTTTLQKTTFAPGEKGVLKADFDGKDLVGTQEKTIRVISDDSSTPTILTLRITIPPWVQVAPRLLWWSIGEEAKPKEALVSIGLTAKTKITSVTSAIAGVTASFLSTDDPARYRLVVQPGSTAGVLFTMVTIHLEAPGAAPRNYTVFVQVR